jgi:hypothetical protein
MELLRKPQARVEPSRNDLALGLFDLTTLSALSNCANSPNALRE